MRRKWGRFFDFLLIIAVPHLAACSAPAPHPSSWTPLATSVNSVERGIHFEGVVVVDPSASNEAIAGTIARQVKTSLGSLRHEDISLRDRDARLNLDPQKWKKQPVLMAPPGQDSARPKPMVKVTYAYDDLAMVSLRHSHSSAISFVMLAGNYTPRMDELKQQCSDDPNDATNSLWYHFTPNLARCQKLVRDEISAIGEERTSLVGWPEGEVMGNREAQRVFLPVTAKLDAPQPPSREAYPEYDRLFGFDSDRQRLVVYAFLGTDKDNASDLNDSLGREAIVFYNTLLQGIPQLRAVHTTPFSFLLDTFINGKKVENVSYQSLFSWILDNRSFPPEATPTLQTLLRQQALDKFAERLIVWEAPFTVTAADGQRKDLILEIRTFFGREDGNDEVRERAKNRYKEAFWHGDIVMYNGHSHFGNGPLEPPLYSSGNFPTRYQVMLINGCLSYNYYNRDFLDLKPGNSRNLDMVVNGLPSYVWGGGLSTARFLLGLLDSSPKSYQKILKDMAVDLPWGERAHDPMRVVDGDLDNTYSPQTLPLQLRWNTL